MKLNKNPFEPLVAATEVSSNPIRIIQGVAVDLKRIGERHYLVRKLLQIVSNPDSLADPKLLQRRVYALRCLENLLRTQFRNTIDLKRKAEDYLNGYEIRKRPVGERIKKARKKLGWTQKELASHLNYKSHVAIVQFERGLRYPPGKVFEWLKDEIM